MRAVFPAVRWPGEAARDEVGVRCLSDQEPLDPCVIRRAGAVIDQKLGSPSLHSKLKIARSCLADQMGGRDNVVQAAMNQGAMVSARAPSMTRVN